VYGGNIAVMVPSDIFEVFVNVCILYLRTKSFNPTVVVVEVVIEMDP
jgi:hypothetical protein